MRLRLSPEPDIYGSVVTDFGEIQVMLSGRTMEDGIVINRGGPSTFVFFVDVPLETYDALVDLHSEGVFQESLIRVCELLTPR